MQKASINMQFLIAWPSILSVSPKGVVQPLFCIPRHQQTTQKATTKKILVLLCHWNSEIKMFNSHNLQRYVLFCQKLLVYSSYSTEGTILPRDHRSLRVSSLTPHLLLQPSSSKMDLWIIQANRDHLGRAVWGSYSCFSYASSSKGASQNT